MENSSAAWARTFRNNAKARAAASNAGPRLAEVAGSTSSRDLARARFFFAVFIGRNFPGAESLPYPRRHAELAKHLAWSVHAAGPRLCCCAPDPSGLKSLRMTPAFGNCSAPHWNYFLGSVCSAYSNTFTTAFALASSTMGARCRGDRTAAASSSCSVPANKSPR